MFALRRGFVELSPGTVALGMCITFQGKTPSKLMGDKGYHVLMCVLNYFVCIIAPGATRH